MGHASNALPAHLRRRAFYRVHGAEQPVNVFAGVGIGFEREQAVGDDLQMLFRLRNEELQNFLRNFRIGRQIGNGRGRSACLSAGLLPGAFGREHLRLRTGGFARTRGLSRGLLDLLKSEWIFLLEAVDLLQRLHRIGADHQQVGFESGNCLGDKLDDRPAGVCSDAGIERVLEDVRQLAGDLAEQRITIGTRSPAQGVGGDVKPLHVIGDRVRVLQDGGVLAQELKMLGGLLQKNFHQFRIRLGMRLLAHARSSPLAPPLELPAAAVALRACGAMGF